MSGTINRISTMLASKKMSYRTLSEITGIPKSAIQRYATGEPGKVPTDRLQAIANALGTTLDYLLGTTENPYKRGSIGYFTWCPKWVSDKQVRIPCTLDSNTYEVLSNISRDKNELIDDTIDRLLHEYIEILCEEFESEQANKESQYN